MKLATFVHMDQERLGAIDASRGILDIGAAGHGLPRDMVAFIEAGDEALAEVRATIGKTEKAGAWLPLDKVRLRAPIPRPRKNVFCIGRNYKGHIQETARARGVEPSFPKVPEVFSKPFTTVVGPDAGIERHARHTQQLDYEVELAIIIGKQVRNVEPEGALDAVYGYTVFNDVSARDAQRAHGQWFKGKGYDTFGPMGPWIVTKDEFGGWAGKRITLKVNSGVRQDSNTSDLLFGVPEIVAAMSEGTTLHPGDIIATGTPSGVALGMTPQKWLQVGDVIEAEIEGIGVLRNQVIA